MQIVDADARITTRSRPAAMRRALPVDEIVTTHAAACPHCLRETFARVGAEGTVYGSCAHFHGIQQTGPEIQVMFEEPGR